MTRFMPVLALLATLAIAASAAGPISAADAALNADLRSAATTAVAAGEPGTEETYWGWVVVRKPSAAAPYTPAAVDAGNSTGGGVSVARLGLGLYEVVFEGLTASSTPEGGVVHVTPISSKQRFCRVDYTTATGSIDLLINVGCFTRLGDPVDTNFALSFLATAVEQGKLGYLRVTSGTDPVIVDQFYVFNSTTAESTVTRLSQGTYSVLFEGLATAGGTALVTTLASTSRCRAGDWATVAQGVQVGVRCYNKAGTLTDGAFMVSFMDALGVKGFGGSPVAYLLANQPSTASYTPSAAFRFSTQSGMPTVKRLQKGLYRVVLPGFGLGGAAIVTATGAAKQLCQLGALPTAGSPKTIDVRCFSPDGLPVNSPFAISFVQ